jgi:2-iminobutanoate/2-iminopropanoate deaminase
MRTAAHLPRTRLPRIFWPALTVLGLAGCAGTPGPDPFPEVTGNLGILSVRNMVGVATPGELDIVPGGIAAETEQILLNLRTVLDGCDRTAEDVFEVHVTLRDAADWQAFREVWNRSFLGQRFPVIEALAIEDLGNGARVAVDLRAGMWAP